jgi:hypothetical protein
MFQKTLIKRKKKDSECVREEINNDIFGFTNYFTAPNIRNKVPSDKKNFAFLF